jgi:hypothetical protein
LAATWGSKPPATILVVVGLLLASAVLAAVHHAEVVAVPVPRRGAVAIWRL